MWIAVTPYSRKFDIGVYVTITSINPLRVYLYSEETLIRFSPSLSLSLYHLHGHFAAGFVPKSTNHLMLVTQNATLLMTTTLHCGRWAQHIDTWHCVYLLASYHCPIRFLLWDSWLWITSWAIRRLLMSILNKEVHTLTYPQWTPPTHSLHLNRSQFHLCVGTNYQHYQESERKSVLHWVYSYCSLSLISGIVSLWTITHKEDHGIPKHQVRFRLSSNDN